MGQHESKKVEFDRYWNLFSDHEKENLENSLRHLTNKEQLEKHISAVLPPSISHRFIKQLPKSLSYHTGIIHKDHYSFEKVVITLAHVVRVKTLEQATMIRHLAMSHPHHLALNYTHHLIHHEEMKTFVEEIIQAFIIGNQTNPHYMSWLCSKNSSSIQLLSTVLLENIKHKEQKHHHGDGYDDESLHHWLHGCQLFTRMLESAFLTAFGVTPCSEESRFHLHDSLIPWCRNINWNKTCSLLNMPSILFLNSRLPLKLRDEWFLMYSTALHGESFYTFMNSTLNKGPLLIVIKDKDGYIFGGFVSENLQVHALFQGTHRSFVFSLTPIMEIYTSTGSNSNYVYINVGQQTLPNGFGMGGQYNYFGLWIDSSFEHGHSKAEPKCSTFDSPQLSSKAEFKIDWIEVWKLGPELQQQQEEEQKKSVLGTHYEDKAMLGLTYTFHSDSLRDDE